MAPPARGGGEELRRVRRDGGSPRAERGLARRGHLAPGKDAARSRSSTSGKSPAEPASGVDKSAARTRRRRRRAETSGPSRGGRRRRPTGRRRGRPETRRFRAAGARRAAPRRLRRRRRPGANAATPKSTPGIRSEVIEGARLRSPPEGRCSGSLSRISTPSRLSRATAAASSARRAESAAARDVVRAAAGRDGSAFATLRRLFAASRGLQRQASAALQVPDELFQRVDEFSDGGVSAVASSAADGRRLETPEKFERGVRRTALDADPPFTNPRRVRDVASRGSDGARPRDRLHFVHGGLEARRAGRRRRQPRRRRRENASLRGFLRDGVHRGDAEEHAGRRVRRARARAFAQRDIAQSCDHERERVRGGEQGRARGRVPARVRRRERVAEARDRFRKRKRLFRVSRFVSPISAAWPRRASRPRARGATRARAREGAAVVRRAFVSR